MPFIAVKTRAVRSLAGFPQVPLALFGSYLSPGTGAGLCIGCSVALHPWIGEEGICVPFAGYHFCGD